MLRGARMTAIRNLHCGDRRSGGCLVWAGSADLSGPAHLTNAASPQVRLEPNIPDAATCTKVRKQFSRSHSKAAIWRLSSDGLDGFGILRYTRAGSNPPDSASVTALPPLMTIEEEGHHVPAPRVFTNLAVAQSYDIFVESLYWINRSSLSLI